MKAETVAQRSAVMRAVPSKNTRPELKLRSALHRQGYRFRLHGAALPGRPDLVFPARRKVIFMHGCFWHGHDCKRGARPPRTNAEYWAGKIGGNIRRDARNREALAALGWAVFVVWECELRDMTAVLARLRVFLDAPDLMSDVQCLALPPRDG